jgi:hypothetical protein
VKNFIAYILAFYVLVSAIVPCSIIDNCEEEQVTEQTSHQEENKDCDNCSPFSICASSSGFTLNTTIATIESIAFSTVHSYSDYYVSSKSEYHSRLFQPPRLG